MGFSLQLGKKLLIKKIKTDIKCKNKISNKIFFNQRILTIITCIFSQPNTFVHVQESFSLQA